VSSATTDQAGWYRDARSPEGVLRWWDGDSWTHQFVVPANPKNWPGIVGLVFGLVDLIISAFLLGIVLGPLGLTFGILGLRQKHDGRRGTAVAAVVLGVIGTLFGLFWMALFSDPDFDLQ
jgi:MFS family permease